MRARKTICIDAGHGGSDPGAVANGLREADIVLGVATSLGRRLQGAGFEVVYTRADADQRPSGNDRWQFANHQNADYFVSIHVNAGGGHGAETFYFRDSSERSRRSEGFAHYVNNKYAANMGLRNRGVRPDTMTHLGSIGVLRHTRMPAILVELAFIDAPANQIDVRLLRDRQSDMAMELADAMLEYFGIEAEQGQPQETPPAVRTVTLDVLGDVQDVRGYIDNGEAFVRLTEFANALGHTATWDSKRRIPVVNPATAATENPPLDMIDSAELAVCADELNLLKQTVHFEARGEDEKGQILVVNVIFNRLNSRGFPNTLHDVILAPGAFTPTQRADFGAAMPNARTVAAVGKALSGIDHSQGATFFHSLNGIHPDVWHERAVRDGRLVHLFDHGGHRFYRET